MSWFDTAGIAILAKNALKEAQKQIDKALDIKEDDEVSAKLFFDQSDSNFTTGAVTKPPTSLPHVSLDDPEYKEKSSTQTDEIDSSESIEVLTPATTPGSALTSPSGQSSNQITKNGGGESESVKIIGTGVTMSSVFTPESISTIDHTALKLDKHRKQQCTALPYSNSDDEISVEDDSFSNTLSEQTITILDADMSLAPITVAPSRSSHSFTIANVPALNDINGECRRVYKSKEENDDHASSSIERCNISKMSINFVNATQYREESTGKPIETLQLTRLSQGEQELEQSYENVELQVQIFDLAHSFEEIKSDSNVVDNISNSTMDRHSENLANLGVFGHSMFNNPADDEIETTTSSDIEIISSPNGGDSSSTHSSAYRTSPLKINECKNENFDMLLIKKRRGHTREPSEISVHSANSDESGQLSEMDRLMRRLVEVSETLEQREYRLVELGRQNAELTEHNALLIAQLENKIKRDGGMDLDDYMQRLSALERKFQQSIREKESLKHKLEALRIEAREKVARGDVDKALVERDFMINELQKEGESLSKQVLQHSNIIKKLRTKEKECDTLIRKQCDEISELMQEAERLKRSLSAKDEVERSQIEAVHKLTSEKRILERECTIFNGNLDDQIQKYESLRKSFEFARNELYEKSELCQDLHKRLSKLQHCETEIVSMERSSALLLGQMEELREQLRRTEIDYGQRLNRAKIEHAELLLRLEATKTIAEEEKNASALLTIPLIKQIDSLQNTLRYKERLWEERDNSFAHQLADGLERIKLVVDKEQSQRELIVSMQKRILTLEERLSATLFESEEISNRLKKKTNFLELLEREYQQQLMTSGKEKLILTDCLKQNSLTTNFQQYKVIQPILTTEMADQQWVKPCVNSLCEDVIAHRSMDSLNEDSNRKLKIEVESLLVSRCAEASPAPSIGNISLPESLNSIPWNMPEDDVPSVEIGACPTDDVGNVGYNIPILFNNTSLVETLQAALKQRDGEVYQLQWDISRFQQERTVLSSEISKLTMELDIVRERFDRSIQQEKEHSELQNRYDALLQMYGESVEKKEELQLDLMDVKEMYKIQIDDLLQRQ
uniref:TMF_TATA_bd domain-containing protein n=1 Tax=Anopheles dirus TaxID=7168 RepID=A0A182NVD4_9DIPT